MSALPTPEQPGPLPPGDSSPRARLRAVPPAHRPRILLGTNPDAIRVLTGIVNERTLPDTYVADGTPVVLEAVSGAPAPAAGDEDAPLPMAISPLHPNLLAGLFAHHTTVYRNKLTKDGDMIEEETSPPLPVLSAVLARRSWPGLPVGPARRRCSAKSVSLKASAPCPATPVASSR